MVNGANRSRSKATARARRRPAGRPCFIFPSQGDVALGIAEGCETCLPDIPDISRRLVSQPSAAATKSRPAHLGFGFGF
ncbi:hypothetical protein DWF74_09250 [Pseudomonas protegens]|nr:hypothetical protein DWF74_09250 [Pseudomonas protegens]